VGPWPRFFQPAFKTSEKPRVSSFIGPRCDNWVCARLWLVRQQRGRAKGATRRCSSTACRGGRARAARGWNVEFPPGSVNEKGSDRISQASAKYFREVDGNHSFISVELVDGTHAPAVNASLAIMSHAVDDVHRTTFTVSGYHGIQHWQPESRSVTAILVMAGRFLVRLKGDNVTTEDVTRLLQSLDARKLEEYGDVRVRRVDVNDVSGPSTAPSTVP
jgi:hypothetical protein